MQPHAHGPVASGARLTCCAAPCPDCTLAAQRCIQRATIKDVVVLRPLGEGAYAWVDLVAVPVQSPCGQPGKKVPKVCAGKLLLPPTPASATDAAQQVLAAPQPSSSAAAAACALARWTAAAAARRGPVKPTNACAYAKQKSAHAACAGSPFVVQLLAAKAGRAGHMLMLLEFAEHGSLGDLLPVKAGEGQVEEAAGEPAGEGADEGAGVAAEEAIGLAAAGMTNQQRPPGGQQQQSAVEEGEEEEQEADDELDLVVDVVDVEDAEQDRSCADSSSSGSKPSVVTDAADAAHESQQQQQQQEGGSAADRPSNQALAKAGIPESTARFYAACALMALEWMHSRSMIHVRSCVILARIM